MREAERGWRSFITFEEDRIDELNKHVAYKTSEPILAFEKSAQTSNNNPTISMQFQENLKKLTTVMGSLSFLKVLIEISLLIPFFFPDYASCVDSDSGFVFIQGGNDASSTVQNKLWAFNPTTEKRSFLFLSHS